MFTSRPRTFLCIRLHSCGGVAIQEFDWILLSGLAKALGCHLQHADSAVAANPVAAADSGHHPSTFLFGCVRPDLTLLNLIGDWPELWVQKMGATVRVGRSERYPEKAHGTL